MSLPPTRILSFGQLVLEADPDWQKDSQRPWLWEFSNRRRFYAPVPLYGVPYESGLWNDGGVLTLVDGIGWPTSPVGLHPGAVWNNGLAIGVVPGSPLVLNPRSVFFPGPPILSAGDLLASGGGDLPSSDPGNLGQLWNNGGEIAVSSGPFIPEIFPFTLDFSLLDGPDALS